MNDKQELLYILAPSYSGSTLLTFLLALHPRIATIGELKATQMGPVDRYLCSCGVIITACEFWNELSQRANLRGKKFSLSEFGTHFGSGNKLRDMVIRASVRGSAFETLRMLAILAIPGAKAKVQSLVDHNFELARIVCELQGGQIFLDGSKDPVRLKYFLESGRGHVKVICLQRDGRGVSNSIRKHEKMDFSSAAIEWRDSVTEILRVRTKLNGEDVFDLRYEELCANPSEVLQHIWHWLGLQECKVKELVGDEKVRHILGNSMRLNRVDAIRLDEKWKATLTEDERAIFSEVCGELNRSLGY